MSLVSVATVSALVPGDSLTRTASATTWIVVSMASGDPGELEADGSTDGDASGVAGDDGPVESPDDGAAEAEAAADGSMAAVPHPAAMMATPIATAPSLEVRQLA